jgi:hypothetical protein
LRWHCKEIESEQVREQVMSKLEEPGEWKVKCKREGTYAPKRSFIEDIGAESPKGGTERWVCGNEGAAQLLHGGRV